MHLEYLLGDINIQFKKNYDFHELSRRLSVATGSMFMGTLLLGHLSGW